MSQRETPPERTFPLGLLATIVAAAVVCSAVFLTWYFGFRDTWEADHAFQIQRLSADAAALIEAGHADEAFEKYDELLAVVGDRKIADPQLQAVYQKALATVGDAKRDTDRRKQAEENLRREAETLAQIARLENEAASKSKADDLAGAIQTYDRALVLVTTSATNNPVFADARTRLAGERDRLADEVEARKRQIEAARAAAQEEERLRSVQAKLRGGAWVTKKAGNSEPLRGLEIFIIRRWASVADTVVLARARVEGERSRLSEANATLSLGEEFLENVRRDEQNHPQIYREFIDKALDAVKGAQESVQRQTQWLREAEDRLAKAEASPPDARIELESVYLARATKRTDAENTAWDELIAKYLVANPHADVEGKYEADLHGGRFYVYASFVSSYSTITWFLPLDVLDAKEQRLDLRNQNADEILNKSE